MFSHLETLLLSLAHSLSLEVFVFMASIVEEIIAPIPSPTVMLLTGSIASVQERAVYALIPLALIGAFGKVIGALAVYVVSDRAEDLVIGKFGKFFGVTHLDVEKFGRKLGNGARDYVFLTVLRALPFIPSVVLSVGSGVLKVPLPLFIFSTFFGTILRDGFYLYAGFVGAEMLRLLITKASHIETYIEVATACLVLSIFVKLFYMHRKEQLQQSKKTIN